MGSAAKPQWAAPPREQQFTPAGAAKCVICDDTIEITIRDSNTFDGLGHDQCRKLQRIVGANTFRLVMAAARTLWFLAQANQRPAMDLRRYRPWYRQKCAPSQLDMAWACREALLEAGVFPIPRFTPDLAENHEEQDHALSSAA